jgi:hypothetical protein
VDPQRVVLLSLGFALFLFSYAVYVRFLGGIDGLPRCPSSTPTSTGTTRNEEEGRR